MSDLDSVRGHHRVAAILLSLEPSEATAIMRNMKLEVVERVANAMLELDPRLTEAGAVDRLYKFRAAGERSTTRLRTGDRRTTGSLCRPGLPTYAARMALVGGRLLLVF